MRTKRVMTPVIASTMGIVAAITSAGAAAAYVTGNWTSCGSQGVNNCTVVPARAYDDAGTMRHAVATEYLPCTRNVGVRAKYVEFGTTFITGWSTAERDVESPVYAVSLTSVQPEH